MPPMTSPGRVRAAIASATTALDIRALEGASPTEIEVEAPAPRIAAVS